MSTGEEENSWKKLDDATVETVLARLRTIDIIRCKLVCKRWKSIIISPTFQNASNQLFERGPWFLMFSSTIAPYSFSTGSSGGVVYDMEVLGWRKINLPIPTTFINPKTTIVSSAGLMCFRSEFNHLIVCNPLTGSKHWLPWLGTPWNIRGIAMHVSSGSNYKVFVAFMTRGNLRMKVFSSSEKKAAWRELPLPLMNKLTVDEIASWPIERIGIVSYWNRYNLNPIKGIGGVTTIGNEGQILVHFLTLIGTLVCFDTKNGTIFMSPRFTAPGTGTNYKAIDLVECGGRVFVVVLLPKTLSVYAKLSVWEFDYEATKWKHIATIHPNPPDNFHFNKTDDINCAGYGNYIMICLNIFSCYGNKVVMYNIKKNTCVLLPRCYGIKDCHRVVWPCSFKPDTEAKI
ncbi:F-box domain [Macleaya cordata]|uniref:F-box domain n=1 Tax=Macleaya cordata TaxID=56857 RepID=A0A200PXD4_MACCD|nr:F-box domain [Macleaya cordata]